ncbi:MAG TPA: PSD1 and planctomycete cytochrome C domain-containing protein, partial [Verrucomicrobiae bacterium]
HSSEAKKVKGGLFLDTRDAVLKGGDTGASIVPGNPDKSLLIKAVRYTDEELQMPPKKKKLPAQQIADLEAWVKMGAPDPRVSKNPGLADAMSRTNHWAFQPVKRPALPVVRNQGWIQTPVDSFILARLEAKQLTPSPRADKRTLIRRATFDLLGLPPTLQEVEAFEADTSPKAYEHLIERLLDSPHYGERWGRYWLDVARYADTKGYVFEEERRYPYSYTYRDWVIRSLNEDLPYNQFIIQQLAADLLPLGEDKRPLAALGYLTLGRRFLNNQTDIIDDRIDVVCRGMMGLTVVCARCHDHKFDPIPTKDYYSLYGIFASCNEPAEKPLLGKQAMPRDYPAYLEERKKRQDELKEFRETKQAEVVTKLRGSIGDYLLALHDGTKSDDKLERLARERKLDPGVARKWRDYFAKPERKKDAAFAPWFALTSISQTNFQADAPEAIRKLEETKNIAPQLAQAFSGTNFPATLKEVATLYNKVFATAAKDEKAEKDDPLRRVLFADNSPILAGSIDFGRLYDVPTSQKLRALQRKIDELDATHPGAPPRAMALVDNATPTTPHVFKRGNPSNPGEEVPRQFIKIVAGENRKPFQKGSGRLELAQAIASPDNPLTARVLVNRVWMYHMGAPLVRTPSDFGVRSDPPTHPELLDYLAARFMEEGWSLKKLHRWIMLSSAYQQSSEAGLPGTKLDPANQLYWRMNRHRLDFESMRDTFLALSGKLDDSVGGRPVELTTEPFTTRRTVYGFVERQNLPGLFRTFDFASPDTTSPQRFATTVPQQALFLMNSPFVVQQAKQLVQRPDVKSLASDDQRIQRLYQLTFQRNPDADEVALAKKFLSSQNIAAKEQKPEKPIWQYGYGAYDEGSKRVKEFHSLPHFTKYAWQGGPDLPDPKLGWVVLNAEGGHPGNDAQHAAIRRWIAPRDGTISISGTLEHNSDKGDGVRGRIVSSRKGLLGEWMAFNSKTNTRSAKLEIRAGDTIDFVTDCRANVGFDSLNWAPVIKYTQKSADDPMEFSAKADFGRKPAEKPKSLGPWEKYAQILLDSNE